MRAKIFFDGLNMGANTLFQVPYMGARFFLKLKRQELFLACEIGGLFGTVQYSWEFATGPPFILGHQLYGAIGYFEG